VTKGPWERREPTDVPAELGDAEGYWWAEGYDAALDACRPVYDAVVAERDRWKARALAVHAAHLEEEEE
jgi:hypothetical protein